MSKFVHLDPSTIRNPWTQKKVDSFRVFLKRASDLKLFELEAEWRDIYDRPSVAEENEIRLKNGRPLLLTDGQCYNHELWLVYFHLMYDSLYQPILDEIRMRGLDLT